jgi:protein-disulfide isomerase
MPTYWQLEPPQLSKEVKTGTTHDGHPWIGAEMPELVIEEFSDYRCFQCKKMHYFLRRLIQSNPDKIRLIHRHFPMDHTINPIVKKPFYMGSAKLAIVSLFAAEHGKFWEMNDVLFNISRQAEAINIKDLAQQAGIGYDNIKYVFQDAGLWKKLKKDIKEGLEYGLTGTPGFVINGEVYLGQIPAEILLK